MNVIDSTKNKHKPDVWRSIYQSKIEIIKILLMWIKRKNSGYWTKNMAPAKKHESLRTKFIKWMLPHPRMLGYSIMRRRRFFTRRNVHGGCANMDVVVIIEFSNWKLFKIIFTLPFVWYSNRINWNSTRFNHNCRWWQLTKIALLLLYEYENSSYSKINIFILNTNESTLKSATVYK